MSYVSIRRFAPPPIRTHQPLVGVGAVSSIAQTNTQVSQVVHWMAGSALVGGAVGALASVYGHGRGLRGSGIGAISMMGIGLLIGLIGS